MKKDKISKNWLRKQNKDIYVRKSKIEGYRSRAAYNLEEINNKFKIFKNNQSIVDLGAAPGSWSQYISKNIKNIKILAIDLKEIKKIENVFLLKGDFTNQKCQNQIKEHFRNKVDIILSDMAVNTTGNKTIDSIVTGELTIEALHFSEQFLLKNGQFVSKIFMCSTFNEIISLGK